MDAKSWHCTAPFQCPGFSLDNVSSTMLLLVTAERWVCSAWWGWAAALIAQDSQCWHGELCQAVGQTYPPYVHKLVLSKYTVCTCLYVNTQSSWTYSHVVLLLQSHRLLLKTSSISELESCYVLLPVWHSRGCSYTMQLRHFWMRGVRLSEPARPIQSVVPLVWGK